MKKKLPAQAPVNHQQARELLKKGKEEKVFLEQVEKGKILWEKEINYEAS